MWKRCYEAYIGETMVARGSVKVLSEALGMSVSTVRSYVNRAKRPKWLDIKPLPVLYEVGGEVMTMRQVEELTGMKAPSIRAAVSNCIRCAGHRVVKHEYDEFAMPPEEVEGLVLEAKVRQPRSRLG